MLQSGRQHNPLVAMLLRDMRQAVLPECKAAHGRMTQSFKLHQKAE